MKEIYKTIFDRVGIGHLTYLTFASGGVFSRFSHEFQTICEAGEDVTYINKEKGIAINSEVLNEDTLQSLGVTREELTETKTAEVGNIFNFGQQKAEDLGLMMKDANGENVPVWMGSYGIGVTRLMGVLVEKFADDKGIVWPEAVAPFKVHLVGLNNDDGEVKDFTDGIYLSLKERGAEVLYDDRDLRAGEKFADSDLLGLPYRVIISKKSKEEGKFEVVTRATGETRLLTEEELYADFDNDENT